MNIRYPIYEGVYRILTVLKTYIKQNRNERITYRYWYLPLLPMPNEKKELQHIGT